MKVCEEKFRVIHFFDLLAQSAEKKQRHYNFLKVRLRFSWNCLSCLGSPTKSGQYLVKTQRTDEDYSKHAVLG